MRIGIGLLGAALLLAGCAHHNATPMPAPTFTTQPAGPVIRPDLRTSGEVEMVNAQARFVVLNFPPGSLPKAEQRLNVYRNGLKVGEVKVTGPQREYNTVADIIAGDAQVHDEVREE